MSRYSRGRVGLSKRPDERSSIGEAAMEQALTDLNRVQQVAMTVMTSYTMSLHKTIGALFEPSIIARATAARNIIAPASNIRPYVLGEKATLFVDYHTSTVPPIEPSFLSLQPPAATLIAFMEAARAIHEQYEEVRGLLKWLNRNATPGAIRYYFPSAMTLAPTSPAWKDLAEVPTRFTPPAHIAKWSQIIKDAAATCTAMVMLPSDVGPRPRQHMWLSFAAKRVDLGDGVSYATDSVTYNL